MANVLHEVWEDIDEEGFKVEMLCLAGPEGDDARSFLGPEARLETTFFASSHFEAMTKYYALYDRGEYTTDFACDHDPYPEA